MNEHLEHNPNDHEDPATGPTWFVGIAGTLILVVTLGGVTALFYRATGEEVVKDVINKSVPELQARINEQQALLRGGRFKIKEGDALVDKDVLPIERAMQLVIEEYKNKPPTAPAPTAAAPPPTPTAAARP